MPPAQKSVEGDFTTGRQSTLVFLVSLIVTGLLNAAYLHMPPVWDAAAGNFAPAIYLYENGFDIRSLLNQPGYANAGPNVHSLGLMTILTWGVMKLAGGESGVYFPVLHLLQIVLSALVLTTVYEMARRLFGSLLAVGITVLLGTLPVFLVQTSYLYTEIAGALLLLLWANAWASRDYPRMVAYLILACAVKAIGFMLLPVQFLLLAVDRSLPSRQRASVMVISLAIPIGLELLEASSARVISFAGPGAITVGPVFDALVQVPDLLVLVVFSLAIPLLGLAREAARRKSRLLDNAVMMANGDYCSRLWLGVALMPPAFMLFLISAPLSGCDFFPLPRYYVWILPFMLFIFARGLVAIPFWFLAKQHLAMLILMLFAGFSVMNRNGNFYPAGLAATSFSIAERSFEYIDYYRTQRAGVRAAAERAARLPIFVTRGEYYFLSSPLMGYVDKKVENIRFILSPPYNSGKLSDYPENFVILDLNSNHYHGIHLVESIVEQASNDNKYYVEKIANDQYGRYHTSLFKIGVVVEGN